MAPLSKLRLTADELPPLVDQLDLLFEMAFDFDEYRNVHGVTPSEVYEHF